MPYFSNGEIERTTAWRLRDYLVECLEEEFLLVDERSQSSQVRSASRRSPVFRVVCGDDHAADRCRRLGSLYCSTGNPSEEPSVILVFTRLRR